MQHIHLEVISKVQVLFWNRSWLTFSYNCAAFSRIHATMLAQSLMRWKNPKGQIMLKMAFWWHFFGLFNLWWVSFFLCITSYPRRPISHSVPPNAIFMILPISPQKPPNSCTRNHKLGDAAGNNVNLHKLLRGRENIKRKSASGRLWNVVRVGITHTRSEQWILIFSLYRKLQAVNMI